MYLKTFLVLSALTLARGVTADTTPLDTRCSNWQTWQTFSVYVTCTDINGTPVYTTLDIGQCINYISPGPADGKNELGLGQWSPSVPGETWAPLPDVCSACGIYNNGVVCRCYADSDMHWSNPIPLDTVFKVNDDGNLACVTPATH